MVSASHLSNSHTLHAWRRKLYAWSLHDEFSCCPCVYLLHQPYFLPRNITVSASSSFTWRR